MGITGEAPKGGVLMELGGETRPFLLTQGQIERFEKQHSKGIYKLLREVMAGDALSIHCRDVAALGLVGAGMSDLSADKLVSEQPSQENVRIRDIALQVLLASFVDPEGEKKSVEDGTSSETMPQTPTDAPKE